MTWPKLLIYEINTWVWLHNLSSEFAREITLETVPDEVVDEIARLNINAVWLMGVWQRSQSARESALNYVHEYRPVLPDLTDEDVIGSAYAIGAYEVDARIGGRSGLAAFRSRLAERGVKLILDFVPNHVAADHGWIMTASDRFVRGTLETLQKSPDLFFEVATREKTPLVIAHGRDPYFPGWIDTAQLNAFSAANREAACATLLDIAAQCDGVRCDMAMLMTNRVFAQTWRAYLGEDIPTTEYWQAVIPAVKAKYPDFTFIAEVYWGMEYDLLQQGFDYTYDKTFYDRIAEGNVGRLMEHLSAPFGFHQCQVRFIENHDEPRAVAALGVERSRAAAVLLCTLPSAVLLHDGQLVGRRVKLPVQVRRQPAEPMHYALASFYHHLLSEARSSIYQHGQWALLAVAPVSGRPDAVETHTNLIAYCWRSGDDVRLIVVNLTGAWSQGILQGLDWPVPASHQWALYDVIRGVYHLIDLDKLTTDGLLVELEPCQATILRLQRLNNHIDGHSSVGH